jgi:hypothetical protein
MCRLCSPVCTPMLHGQRSHHERQQRSALQGCVLCAGGSSKLIDAVIGNMMENGVNKMCASTGPCHTHSTAECLLFVIWHRRGAQARPLAYISQTWSSQWTWGLCLYACSYEAVFRVTQACVLQERADSISFVRAQLARRYRVPDSPIWQRCNDLVGGCCCLLPKPHDTGLCSGQRRCSQAVAAVRLP